jgi:hypothetical protein
MTTEDQIIKYLQGGNSSAHALSIALKVPQKSCQTVLNRMEDERKVMRLSLSCGLVTYKLIR